MSNLFHKIHEEFPTTFPKAPLINETRMAEAGAEKLLILKDVTWPRLDQELYLKIAEEAYQLAVEWRRYYFPSEMLIGLNIDGNDDDLVDKLGFFVGQTLPTKIILERNANISGVSVYEGMTASQLALVAEWLRLMREKIPRYISFTDNEIDQFLLKANKLNGQPNT